MQFGGAAAAFAVSSLRKIGELEINRESFGDAVSLFNGQARDDVPRLIQQRVFKIEIFKSGALKSGEAFGRGCARC